MEETGFSDPARRPLRSAIESPETEALCKQLMIRAMCSNDVLGIPIAAMQYLSDPTKWEDGVDLWEVSFATHARWLESDPEYAKTILWLEKEGFKAQRQGHWACGLGMMAEDPQVWKGMLGEFARVENELKKPQNEQKSPFDGLSDELLLKIREELNAKKMKVVS